MQRVNWCFTKKIGCIFLATLFLIQPTYLGAAGAPEAPKDCSQSLSANSATPSQSSTPASDSPNTLTPKPRFAFTPSNLIFEIKTVLQHPGIIRDAISLAMLYARGNLKTDNPEFKKVLLRLGARFKDSGKLESVVRFTLGRAREAGKLPKIYQKPEMFEKFVSVTLQGLSGQLALNGASREGKDRHYENWIDLSYRVYREIHQEAKAIPSVKSDEFRLAIERQAKTRFTTADQFEFLVDGPAAYNKRIDLINSAKQSIHIMCWSFEDDNTGEFFSELLIKRFREGIDVKIMVDEQTSRRKGYHLMLDKMEAAGIPVIRWTGTDLESKYTVMHKKFTLIDGFTAVGGGTNFADYYSHMGPAEKAKWRDTDAWVSGALAWDSQMLFARMWNEQVKHLKNPKLKKIELWEFRHFGNEAKPQDYSPVRAALINHDPGQSESILRTILLSIE